ncbi:MAG: TldD/PmbA family protein [Candidatus Eremiobacteraeota bacterium]|nr:TldD/PmbA family protein [Candidatus Eremiobacteraeota bacterium]
MLNAAHALELAEKVLKYCAGADQAEVDVNVGNQAYSRFARNYVTQNLSGDETTVSVQFVKNKHIGNATSGDLSEAGLRKLVADAAEIAKRTPPNTEFISLPKKETIAGNPEAVFDSSKDATPDARVDKLLPLFARMEQDKLLSAGYLTTQYGAQAIANSLGVRAAYESTLSGLEVKAMAENTSGYAEYWSRDFGTIDTSERADLAARKATVSREPQDFAPGTYTVILEPPAFSNVLGGVLDGMDIGSVIENKDSWMVDQIGKPLLSKNLTIVDDWSHPLLRNAPFSPDGAPTKKLTLIENGVPKHYVTNTLLANKYKVANTGHPGFPANSIVLPGTKTREQLIAETERGILVSRTWYTRVVDPKQQTITGLTRDGVFLIENGKLTKTLKNFRFFTSMLTALSDIELGSQVYFSGSAADSASVPAVPVAKIGKFTFSAQASFA